MRHMSGLIWNFVFKLGLRRLSVGSYLQKDIKRLEKIQRRATKMVHGLKDIAYETGNSWINFIGKKKTSW